MTEVYGIDDPQNYQSEKLAYVYRITFNPQEYSNNTEEFVILFGEECVSINGVTYAADDNVSYSDILSWAENKYKFFDYDLITD